MEVTPVGDDLHVLLTGGDHHELGCTAFSAPVPDTDPVEVETSIITTYDDPEPLFTIYVAENLARHTGKNVVCSGGIFVDDPDEHQVDKLYENVDSLIKDWVTFYD